QRCWNLHGKCRQKCSRRERTLHLCPQSSLCMPCLPYRWYPLTSEREYK
uniref:Beta-defensin n=2 Tax=Canis lupus familiaris TaxID=9615 RepID=A0A8C0TE80_CANLF